MTHASSGGDALDRELASLKETIGLTNPLTYGVKGDWKTTTIAQREKATHEGAVAKTLPTAFVLTEPRQSLKAFKAAADAAKSPAKPLRPQPQTQLQKAADDGNGASARRRGSAGVEVDPSALVLQRRALTPSTMTAKRVPMAKRSHMDGVLHGLPGDRAPTRSTVQDSITYSDDMQTMNRDKDTSFHRKRDAYSEYVEARARFSKMHSVN